MAAKTNIGWACRPGTIGATWNAWRGCKKKSPGCAKCYMYREYQRRPAWGDPREVVRSRTTFEDPLHWKEPHTIFTCSLSDWNNPEADLWRPAAWDIVRRTPQHTYLILTKLPERWQDERALTLPKDWGEGWPNVWLGTSAENQEYADWRIPILLSLPARVHFVSAEPLLGPIHMERGWLMPDPDNQGARVDWVITGGESDFQAPRPCNLAWVRDMRDQCLAAGIPFFHKQNGGSRRIDGVWGGRILDGRTWNEFPLQR